jgi:hypothetical protein
MVSRTLAQASEHQGQDRHWLILGKRRVGKRHRFVHGATSCHPALIELTFCPAVRHQDDATASPTGSVTSRLPRFLKSLGQATAACKVPCTMMISHYIHFRQRSKLSGF